MQLNVNFFGSLCLFSLIGNICDCKVPFLDGTLHSSYWASLVARMVKNLPAMRETRVQYLSWEDALDEGNATRSSILAWRVPWTEEPGRLQFMGS